MPSESKKRILAVDDSGVCLALLQKHLELSGYEVVTARNGREALEVLQREGIQLVVTDWNMPEMDGVEFCRAVRSAETVRFVFVVILTAHPEKSRLLEAFEAGADDFLPKPFDRQELLARLRAGERIIALENGMAERTLALHKVNAELAVLADKLDRRAATDELTGLINRRYGLSRLDEYWAQATRYGRFLSCIMMDLDHFKTFNDTYGHAAGDLVLQETAALLTRTARAADVVCRIGGEEMLVICPNTSAESAAVLAERCRQNMEALELQFEEHTLRVTASFGVSQLAQGISSRDDLLAAADRAMYAAKDAGRNRVQVAEDTAEPWKSATAAPMIPP
jgi:diguanylate cyclase (GGDEF)-like protein